MRESVRPMRKRARVKALLYATDSLTPEPRARGVRLGRTLFTSRPWFASRAAARSGMAAVADRISYGASTREAGAEAGISSPEPLGRAPMSMAWPDSAVLSCERDVIFQAHRASHDGTHRGNQGGQGATCRRHAHSCAAEMVLERLKASHTVPYQLTL